MTTVRIGKGDPTELSPEKAAEELKRRLGKPEGDHDGDEEKRQGKKGKNRPQDKRHRAAKDERRAEGVQAAAAITPAGDGPKEEKGGPQVAKAEWVFYCHEVPVHDDEAAAAYILLNYGEQKYPGISKARLATLTSKDDVSALLQTSNIVMLGVGGAEAKALGDKCEAIVFDEHVLPKVELDKTCCAKMVAADVLTSSQQMLWEDVLERVCHYDRHHAPLHTIPYMVKVLQKGPNPLSFEEIVARVVTPYLDEVIRERQGFFNAIAQKTHDKKFPFGNGTVQVSFIRADDFTDTDTLTRVCRWRGSKLILSQDQEGRTAFLASDLRLTKIMDFITKLVRTKEPDMYNAEIAKMPESERPPKRPFEKNWDTLGKPGTLLPQAPGWFRDAQNGLFLVNRSGRKEEKEKTTRIPWETFCSIVDHAFNGAWMTEWANTYFGVRP